MLTNKSVTLVANVSNTLVWSSGDFQNALGSGSATVPFPFALELSVTNNTAQVVYLSVAYTTDVRSVALVGGRPVGAVPALTSATIGPRNSAELGFFDKNVQNITVTLVSAADGTVTISPVLRQPGSAGGGGAGGYIGGSDRSAQDYTIIPFCEIGYTTGPGFFTPVDSYTVPTGKRAFLENLYASIDPTPSYPGTMELIFGIAPSGIQIKLKSEMNTSAQLVIPTRFYEMNAGDTLIASVANNDGGTQSYELRYSVTIKEVF